MMRYSNWSPERLGFNGWALNMRKSSQRSRTSSGLTESFGDGLPVDRTQTGAALELEAFNSAVTPASLCTFTRKERQPCSTNAGRASEGDTFTRLSGLIWTSSRQYLSRIFCNWAMPVAESEAPRARESSVRSCDAMGAPR